jgi:CRISPR-associated endonuclease Csn1
MTKILGIDLGVSSIGWALIEEKENPSILDLGSRVISHSTDDEKEFTQGQAITKNQERTTRRTLRKGYDRYQLRKAALKTELEKLGMLPGAELFALSAVELYGLRNKALTEKISLQKLGRILFHLNQKRGYRSSKKDQSKEAKDTEYVAKVKSRYELIKEKDITVGQFFYQGLLNNSQYRVKEQIFPRDAYKEELYRIWEHQSAYYPEVLNMENKERIAERIIYYQRPLKSQKGLVSVCELEGAFFKREDGKVLFGGPKVAPRSSPLAQVSKVWESINNIRIKKRGGDELEITSEQKKELFQYLDSNKMLSQKQLFGMLGIHSDEYTFDDSIKRGIKGNITKCKLLEVLEKHGYNENLLSFDLLPEEYESVNIQDGEIIKRKRIPASIEKAPLYKLWHIIYSIPEEKDIIATLKKEFQLPDALAAELADIDFTAEGFGNKSAKAIRKTLPYLMDGMKFSHAKVAAGYLDTVPEPVEKLALLPKGALRQPIVEKILNQLINLVNSLLEQPDYRPDEMRIELARELKQGKEARKETFEKINEREKQNIKIRERIHSEFGLKPTSKRVEKWRLWHEVAGRCLYCGAYIPVADFLAGRESDVEHIIPQSILFDDSFANKTISHVACNKAKGNKTAWDYMKTKSDEEVHRYQEEVKRLYKNKKGYDKEVYCDFNKIGKRKHDYLFMPLEKIPKDFIQRQLTETQYIARKAKELLNQVCPKVHSTSGTITSYLRHEWGWDQVLMNLHLPAHKARGGATEVIERESKGQLHSKELIPGWSKRMDHRHHAIDALTIACTKQGIIQRINTLSQKDMLKEGDNEGLKIYIQKLKPFTTHEVEKAVSQVLVSFKPGKKVATLNNRKIKKGGKKIVVQENIVVPRGRLSEESVYGKIRRIVKNAPLKELFENPEHIVSPKIKALILERLAQSGNDVKKAIKSLSITPLYSDSSAQRKLVSASMYREEVVLRYPLASIAFKDLDSVVDERVREVLRARLAVHNNNPKEAFKDLSGNPVWLNEEKGIQIKSMRCYTGLSAVEPVRKNENGVPISFVKPGNNHHIALYRDATGKRVEHVVTFWHAVLRKKHGIPVIIRNPDEVWQKLEGREELPQDFLEKLPDPSWTFEISLQQNEMVVVGMSQEEVWKNIGAGDFAAISQNLYRVQKLSTLNYCFRHHLETTLENKHAQIQIQSVDKLNVVKVKLNYLGKITAIGEQGLKISTKELEIKIR